MTTRLLDSLIGTDCADKLISNPDSVDSFCLHERSEELKELFIKDYFDSVLSALDWWEGPVDVHLPEARDEATSLTVNAHESQKYFATGHGLLLNDIESQDHSLIPGIQEVIQTLNLPSLTYGRHLIYMTPKRGGTAAHFDQNINIVIQIHGEKKWWVAKNESVQLPLTRHTLGLPGDGELSTYLDAPYPQSMPENAKEYTLRPGSVLFVPRGSWHKTYAKSDAVALNLTLSPPSYADLYLATLRSYLICEPSWRKSAQWNNEKDFQELISGLHEKIHLLGLEEVRMACEF